LLKRKRLKPISDKRKAQLPEYHFLVNRLRALCFNKSELSGDNPDWQSKWLLDPQHINGKNGKRFLDPFNLILLTRTEHDIEGGKIKGEKVGKEKLLEIIRPIRIKQGFEEE